MWAICISSNLDQPSLQSSTRPKYNIGVGDYKREVVGNDWDDSDNGLSI